MGKLPNHAAILKATTGMKSSLDIVHGLDRGKCLSLSRSYRMGVSVALNHVGERSLQNIRQRELGKDCRIIVEDKSAMIL